MKIKTNLPYYQNMKAKVEGQIKSLKEQLESKSDELASLDSIIGGLEKIEAKEEAEPAAVEQK